MNTNTRPPVTNRGAEVSLPIHTAHLVPVLALGMGLSLSLVISYVLCVIGYLVFPSLPIEHSALAIFLPGFTLLSWPSFFLGLVESFGWGWYVALVFGPIYNFFAARS
jgi:2TM family of unknown function (DUF5676)